MLVTLPKNASNFIKNAGNFAQNTGNFAENTDKCKKIHKIYYWPCPPQNWPISYYELSDKDYCRQIEALPSGGNTPGPDRSCSKQARPVS